MVLLPEEAEMTLAELRQMAARQQHQIEAQQQLLVAKEQRLKFLKQQEARHHHLTELKVDPVQLQNLKEKVETQELKLKHLRALHGQVEQQKTNNNNLSAELESIRALFSEKEKELNVAVSKVEELTRQLDDIRTTKNHKMPRVPPSMIKLDDLRRELMYQTKVSEQQSQQIFQQREMIAQKQHDMGQLDRKIVELTQRLQRKRLMNQQLSNQIHNVSLVRQYASSPTEHMYQTSNVATVEPMQREALEPDHTQDDMSAKLSGSHQRDLCEFSLKKSDPKYQTLPYNTKFSLKGKHNLEDVQSDDVSCSSENSLDSNVALSQPPPPPPPLPSQKNMLNFAPRPFTNYTNSNNNSLAAKTASLPVHQGRNENTVPKPHASVQKSGNVETRNENESKSDVTDSNIQGSIDRKSTSIYSMEGPADLKKVKDKCVSGKITTSKPVVPPKPTLPVKPIPPPRQTPLKERSNDDKTDVSLALSVLQSKSSSKEKCAARHALKLTPTEGSPPESELSTYFHKNLVPTETKNPELKRKPLHVQLPIKPKPLTIRKTPGLEPPKLKVQQNTALTAYKRLMEPNILSASFKNAMNDPGPLNMDKAEDSLLGKDYSIDAHGFMSSSDSDVSPQHHFPVISANISSNGVKLDGEPPDSLESINSSASDKGDEYHVQNGFKVAAKSDDRNSSGSASPCDSLECVPIQSPAEAFKSDIKNCDKDVTLHQSAAFRRMKGNLKTEGSVRSPRRVSFDPLALLLDAALEGELELVKKTAREVPNPSAANDEGITALHNAICAGHFDVVKFLIEFGCDVNAQDSDGWTPLHCAASCNNLPMVKFLVERGACIFATTLSDHETAAEKCEEEDEGFDSCSEYLYGLQDSMGIVNDGIVFAVYDYEGLNPDELSFKEGSSIKILRNGDEQESEWWWSRLNDQEGYVPRNLFGLYPRIPKKD